jgi:hypothetical protein
MQTRSVSNVVERLTRALADVQIVTGYVRIAFLEQLYSMSILPNLTRIEGKELYKKRYARSTSQSHPPPHRYSLAIIGNENLREIKFAQNFQIDNGKVMVQNNAHLCYEKIIQFLKQVNIEEVEDDINAQSNGHQEICACLTDFPIYANRALPITGHQDTLTLNIRVNGDVFEARWTAFNNSDMDHRNFLGYLIYYKVVPGPDSVKDIYANRDACSDRSSDACTLYLYPPFMFAVGNQRRSKRRWTPSRNRRRSRRIYANSSSPISQMRGMRSMCKQSVLYNTIHVVQ